MLTTLWYPVGAAEFHHHPLPWVKRLDKDQRNDHRGIHSHLQCQQHDQHCLERLGNVAALLTYIILDQCSGGGT